ncbi:MAG: SDR family oxidoreductase [Pelagimonas sp.]|nr:SDR family oxidoreductase [Pelagimonas sp.]
MEPGSYAQAMQGCGVVFHTASPFTISVNDPQKELIEPAVQGTKNVLEQANATPGVSRMVLTSSCAAIYGDNIDCSKASGGRVDESAWNTSSGLEHNVYSYSKTLAEKRLGRSPMPKWLVWLTVPLAGDGITCKLVARNVNVPFRADNSKAKRALGVTYRSLNTSLEDMFQQMINARRFQTRG